MYGGIGIKQYFARLFVIKILKFDLKEHFFRTTFEGIPVIFNQAHSNYDPLHIPGNRALKYLLEGNYKARRRSFAIYSETSQLHPSG